MSNWLNKLERKLGKYAIPNLMYYVIILYALGYVLNLINPLFYFLYLQLDAAAILHGQVWRIVTFIIQPPSMNLILLIFALYLYYMIGRQLEMTMGSFRFNFYFFTGMLLHVIAAILVYLLTGVSLTMMSTWYLNMSLFFVFAAFYPDVQFLMFFAIPIKAKWLACIDALYFLYAIVPVILPFGRGGSVSEAVAAAVSALNFLLFYLSTKSVHPYSPKQVKRKREYQRKVNQARRPDNTYANGAKHRCAVCGRTELDDPRLEFRYCSKCNGNYEYCQDHLFTHTHVK